MSSTTSSACCVPCSNGASHCTGQRYNNSWVIGDVNPATNTGGVCILDTLTPEEIGCVLQKNPFARADLPKITSDPEVLALLEKYPLLSSDWPAEKEMNRIGAGPAPLFYTHMGGRLSDYLRRLPGMGKSTQGVPCPLCEAR